MHEKVYVVARTRREANDYAAENGLKRSDFTVISEVGQLRAARRGEIHLVDGWELHPKRHALRAALRFARIEVFDVAAAGAEAPRTEATSSSTDLDPGLAAAIEAIVPSPIEGLDERGALTERQLEVAHRYNRLRDEAPDATPVTLSDLGVTGPQSGPLPFAPPVPPVSSEDEQTTEAESSEDPAPAQEPVGRRRSRCKSCDQLHYKGDPCPSTED